MDPEGNPVLAGIERAQVLRKLGRSYEIKGEYDAAISSFAEALGMKDEEGRDVLTGIDRAQLLNSLGDAHAGKRAYKTAIHHYREALQLPGNNENEFALPDEERTRIRQKIEQFTPLLD